MDTSNRNKTDLTTSNDSNVNDNGLSSSLSEMYIVIPRSNEDLIKKGQKEKMTLSTHPSLYTRLPNKRFRCNQCNQTGVIEKVANHCNKSCPFAGGDYQKIKCSCGHKVRKDRLEIHLKKVYHKNSPNFITTDESQCENKDANVASLPTTEGISQKNSNFENPPSEESNNGSGDEVVAAKSDSTTQPVLITRQRNITLLSQLKLRTDPSLFTRLPNKRFRCNQCNQTGAIKCVANHCNKSCPFAGGEYQKITCSCGRKVRKNNLEIHLKKVYHKNPIPDDANMEPKDQLTSVPLPLLEYVLAKSHDSTFVNANSHQEINPQLDNCFSLKNEHLQKSSKKRENVIPKSKLKCTFCKAKFCSISAVSAHKKYLCYFKRKRYFNFSCCVCEKKFGNVNFYKSHLKNVHRIFLLPSKSYKPTSSKKLLSISLRDQKTCLINGRYIKIRIEDCNRKINLKKTKSNETPCIELPNKPFQCSRCKKASRHCRLKCPYRKLEDQILKCSCGETIRRVSLRNHLKTIRHKVLLEAVDEIKKMQSQSTVGRSKVHLQKLFSQSQNLITTDESQCENKDANVASLPTTEGISQEDSNSENPASEEHNHNVPGDEVVAAKSDLTTQPVLITRTRNIRLPSQMKLRTEPSLFTRLPNKRFQCNQCKKTGLMKRVSRHCNYQCDFIKFQDNVLISSNGQTMKKNNPQSQSNSTLHNAILLETLIQPESAVNTSKLPLGEDSVHHLQEYTVYLSNEITVQIKKLSDKKYECGLCGNCLATLRGARKHVKESCKFTLQFHSYVMCHICNQRIKGQVKKHFQNVHKESLHTWKDHVTPISLLKSEENKSTVEINEEITNLSNNQSKVSTQVESSLLLLKDCSKPSGTQSAPQDAASLESRLDCSKHLEKVHFQDILIFNPDNDSAVNEPSNDNCQSNLDLKSVDVPTNDPEFSLSCQPDKAFQCLACHRIYSNINQMNAHIKYLCPKNSIETFMYKCNFCGKGYINRRKFTKHLYVHGVTKNNKNGKENRDISSFKQCPLCCLLIKNCEKFIASHYNLCLTQNSLKCQDCGKIMETVPLYEVHRLAVCNKPAIRGYPCGKCEYIGDKLSDILSHVKTLHNIHMNVDDIITVPVSLDCFICDAKFKFVKKARFHVGVCMENKKLQKLVLI